MSPQIIEYTAENAKLQPTEVGIEATAAAARRVNAAYNEAAGLKAQTGHIFARGLEQVGNAAVTYLDHQQISAGSAAFAGLTAKATQDWNDRNQHADPRDPSTGKSWLQNVLEPSLQQFQQGFITDKGQQWAAAHVEHLRNHFTTKVTSDMSRKAGEAVAIEQGQALQSWANTVRMDGTVSTLEEAIGTLNGDKKRAGHTADVVDSSPNLDDKIGVKTKLQQKNMEVLVQNAAEGAIYKTGKVPEWATSKRYSPYVDLEDLQKKADQRQRQMLTVDRAFTAEQKRDNLQAAHDAQFKSETENRTFDPDTNRYTYKPQYFDDVEKIRRMPEGGKIADAMEAKAQRQQDKKPMAIRDNPDIHQDLLDRLSGPTDHPTSQLEIDMAENKDQITSATAKKLTKLNHDLTIAPIKDDPMMQVTLDAVKKLIGTDAVGKGKYADFFHSFVPQYLALPADKRADALNLKPESKSLLSTTMQPLMRDMVTRAIDKRLGGSDLPAAPPPAPTATPVAIPAPNLRVKDKDYTLPNGQTGTWTGQGWRIKTAPAGQ